MSNVIMLYMITKTFYEEKPKGKQPVSDLELTSTLLLFIICCLIPPIPPSVFLNIAAYNSVFQVSMKPGEEGDGEVPRFEMETSGWVDWREIFRNWMMTTRLDTMRTEQSQFQVEEEVTCLQVSGGYLVMGLGSGARSELKH